MAGFYDTVMAGLRRERPATVPVTSFMTGVNLDLMKRSGAFWPEAHRSASAMVALAAAAYRHYGYMTMKLPFDMAVEAEAVGGRIDFGGREIWPQVVGHPLDIGSPVCDWEGAFPELFGRGRFPLVFEAIALAKAEYSGVIPVVSSIVGPFTLAGKLYGFEDLLVSIHTDPGALRAALEGTTALCIDYMRRQAEAGCDVIQIGEASCSGDLISPEVYQDFILPCHRALAQSCAVPTVLHICGNIGGHLPHIARTGLTALSFDVKTDLRLAVEVLHSAGMAAVGCVDTLEVLLNGTPELVYQKSWECLRGGVDLLNAGCAWAPDTPEANARAMVRAASDWRG